MNIENIIQRLWKAALKLPKSTVALPIWFCLGGIIVVGIISHTYFEAGFSLIIALSMIAFIRNESKKQLKIANTPHHNPQQISREDALSPNECALLEKYRVLPPRRKPVFFSSLVHWAARKNIELPTHD